MALQFVPFEEHHIPAAKAFNQRMIDGHAATDFFLPTVLRKSRSTQTTRFDGRNMWFLMVMRHAAVCWPWTSPAG